MYICRLLYAKKLKKTFLLALSLRQYKHLFAKQTQKSLLARSGVIRICYMYIFVSWSGSYNIRAAIRTKEIAMCSCKFAAALNVTRELRKRKRNRKNACVRGENDNREIWMRRQIGIGLSAKKSSQMRITSFAEWSDILPDRSTNHVLPFPAGFLARVINLAYLHELTHTHRQ